MNSSLERSVYCFYGFYLPPKTTTTVFFFFKNKPRRMSKRKKQKKIPIQCHEINGSVHLAAIFNKVYKKLLPKKNFLTIHCL